MDSIYPPLLEEQNAAAAVVEVATMSINSQDAIQNRQVFSQTNYKTPISQSRKLKKEKKKSLDYYKNNMLQTKSKSKAKSPPRPAMMIISGSLIFMF